MNYQNRVYQNYSMRNVWVFRDAVYMYVQAAPNSNRCLQVSKKFGIGPHRRSPPHRPTHRCSRPDLLYTSSHPWSLANALVRRGRWTGKLRAVHSSGAKCWDVHADY